MIKYLGSKRRLVPVLEALASLDGVERFLDLFAGTGRVGMAAKRAGCQVVSVDRARFACVLNAAHVGIDASQIDRDELADLIDELDARPGVEGYVTRVFCRNARFFHPDNGRRIDAVRAGIDELGPHPLRSVLLTALIEAADRVDSTTGVQMAYLKQWAPRAHRSLSLTVPELTEGAGLVIRGDAVELAAGMRGIDLAYLDPPYNQHRYEANYHVWETLVRNDDPDHYGVACKRVDLRDRSSVSVFNRRRLMPAALARTIADLDVPLLVVSHGDDSWLGRDEVIDMCRRRGSVVTLSIETDRYVGARIGVYDPAGKRVGQPGRTRTNEHLTLSGDPALVEAGVSAATRADERLVVD